MKKLVVFSVAAVLLLVVSAAVQPANAICSSSRSFTSGYIYTPGVCVDGGGDGPCDASGSSVSAAFVATFWHVGNGNPAEGLGSDSDGFPAVPNWVFPYPGYPVVIAGDWGTDQRIDGCIDAPQPGGPAAKCMAVQMYDVDLNGDAHFAIFTKGANATGDYAFGDGPFNLAPMPALDILNTVRTAGGVDITAILNVADLEAGLFLDTTGACADVTAGAESLFDGYRLRYRTVPRDSGEPDDPTTGWQPCGGVIPIGQSGTCSVPTPSDVDVYLSYSLLSDSGFESGVTGDEATRIQGGPNVADPAPRIQIRQGGKVPVRSN